MGNEENDWREILRNQESTLDALLLARVAAVRRRALAERRPPWWRLHAPALGGAVLATVLTVAVLLPLQHGITVPEEASFYDNLDFYLWLADSEMGTRD